jgi:excinuclease ABC subunit B
VILYADRETDSLREAVRETIRRRTLQEAYNREHGITPRTVESQISSLRDSLYEADYVTPPLAADAELPLDEIPKRVKALRREMQAAVEELDFERAAKLRDQIIELEERALLEGFEAPAPVASGGARKSRRGTSQKPRKRR